MIAQHFSPIIRQSTLNKCRIIHLKQVRQISISAISRQTMEDAKNKVSLLKEDPGNDAKLKMYALYKQATVGKCNTKKPGVFDFVGQAKWSAWSDLGDMTKEDAEKAYISFVDELAAKEGLVASKQDVQENTDPDKIIQGLDVTKENGICRIKFNRPQKLNALTHEMYNGITDTLNEVAKDGSIKVLLITGAGKYYCSGNDLSNFTKIPPEGPQQMAEDARETLRHFVNAFINFPKLLVCAVNGPAVGISVTTLALADLVYASDTATFHTPFMSLGQSPEACSSYTFPKIMGYTKANEVLLAGKKLTAEEALDRNLLTKVIPDASFEKVIEEKLQYLASLPPMSVMYSKALERDREKETLLRVNEEECTRLKERWLSEECAAAVMKFLSKTSKM